MTKYNNPTKNDDPKKIRIAFLGDIMLGRGVNSEIKYRPAEYFWGDTLSILKSMDLVVGNLECSITEHKTRWQKTEKVFYFRADPKAADVLKAGNVGCVSLANNHVLDFEEEGLIDTIKYLDLAGIKHVGAGSTIVDAKRPAFVDIKGVRIRIIGATDNEPAFAATSEKPGTNYVEIRTDDSGLEFFSNLTNELNQKADFTVCSLHWGPNMVRVPPENHQEFAQRIINSGINVVHGHSAHNFQAVEKIGDGLVLFDTGDFIDDYAVDQFFRNDWSFIFIVEVEDAKIVKLRMVPVVLSYAQVNLAKGDEFDFIRRRMEDLCEEFETPIEFTDEGLGVNF